MRILVCAAEAPLPPLNGGRLQTSNLVRGLARRHDVEVLAYRWPDQTAAPEDAGDYQLLRSPRAASRARSAAEAILRGLPTVVVEETSPMAAALRDRIAARRPDVVHVAGARLAATAPALDGVPAVLASLDAWHLNVDAAGRSGDLARRLIRRREAWAVKRFGRQAYRPFASVVMVSDPDAVAARALDPSLRLDVVPNGVDTEEYAPDPGVGVEPGLVVFVGAMQWAPNAQAARFLSLEVWPHVRRRAPHARLALVGRRPDAIADLAALPNVDVVGEVPDVRPWLHRATAFACPMISGTGIKNKLLEAMACGAASVGTPLALQGMQVTEGQDVLVGRNAVDFADRLVDVLEDAELRARLARAGREYVVSDHSWDAVVARYEAIYRRAIDGADGRSAAPMGTSALEKDSPPA